MLMYFITKNNIARKKKRKGKVGHICRMGQSLRKPTKKGVRKSFHGLTSTETPTDSQSPACLPAYLYSLEFCTEVVFWSGAWYVCLLIITVITGTLVSLKKGYMLVVAIRICFLFIYVSSKVFQSSTAKTRKSEMLTLCFSS